jgi:hypothetical protein
MKLTTKEKSRRIKEGQARSNKKIGRPPRLNHQEIIRISKFKTVIELARQFGTSKQAIHYILNKNNGI